MKKFILNLTVIAGLSALCLTGCKPADSTSTTVDTAKTEAAFSAPDGTEKSQVEKAVSAIKAGDYASAVASLKEVAASTKLTPVQQDAIKDLVAQVEAKISSLATEAADKAKAAASDAGKAAEKAGSDLQKSIAK